MARTPLITQLYLEFTSRPSGLATQPHILSLRLTPFRTTGLGEAHTSICNWKRFFSPGDCGVQGDILVAPSDRDYLRACILSAVLRHNSRQ